MSVVDPATRLFAIDIPTTLLEHITACAPHVDAGAISPRDALPDLAAAGLVDLGAPQNHGGALVDQLDVLHTLAGRCFATAFTLWAHRMVIEFLTVTGGAYAQRILPSLRNGSVPGVSAMAPGFKNIVGAGDLSLTVSRDTNGELRLSGRLAWASNLYPDAQVISAAYGPDGTHQRVIVAFALNSPGISVGQELNLLALRATGSTSITLDDVFIHEDQILTDDYGSFMQRCRPIASLLQSALCLGLASASLS